MKRLILLFSIFIAICPSWAQKSKSAKIYFSANIFVFDTLEQEKEAACYFYYENTGSSDLVLYNVFSSCGCTIPQWDKKPLPPGKKGVIKVIYHSGNPGSFQKTIVVKSNATNDPQKTLRIKGFVKP